MTEYLKKSFTVPLGGDGYAAGWERIFGSREGEKAGDFGASIGDMPNAPDLATVEEETDAMKLKRSKERAKRQQGFSK